jgi:hypothetical protein
MKLTHRLVHVLPLYRRLQLTYSLPDKKLGLVTCSRVEKHTTLKYHIEYHIEQREGNFSSKEIYTLIHHNTLEPFVDYTRESTFPHLPPGQEPCEFRVTLAVPV